MKCDYLLMNFCGNDKIRNTLHFPCTIGNITYASDASALISIKNNKTNYQKKEYPDFENPFSTFSKSGDIIVNKTELLDILSNTRFEYLRETKKCDKCNGEGSVKCSECGNTHDCEKCDASGEIEDKKSLQIKHILIIDEKGIESNYINFQDKITLRPINVERMLLTMLFFNVENITISFNEKDNNILFKPIDDVRVIMMQYRT